LLQQAQEKPSNLPFRDLIALAEAAGFTMKRVKGGHHILTRPGTPEILVFQPRKGRAKPYQVRQLLTVIERHGIALE
jgi:predicted RNA binding protein YcfA (HicA-like mRNA interferase family)